MGYRSQSDKLIDRRKKVLKNQRDSWGGRRSAPHHEKGDEVYMHAHVSPLGKVQYLMPGSHGIKYWDVKMVQGIQDFVIWCVSTTQYRMSRSS